MAERLAKNKSSSHPPMNVDSITDTKYHGSVVLPKKSTEFCGEARFSRKTYHKKKTAQLFPVLQWL
jgi:hypothetical protein